MPETAHNYGIATAVLVAVVAVERKQPATTVAVYFDLSGTFLSFAPEPPPPLGGRGGIGFYSKKVFCGLV